MKNLREWKKQVIKFGIIGVLAVLTDLVCYYLLLGVFPEKLFSFITNEVSAKTISFICGAVVTYNLNKLWTWRKKDSSKVRFAKFMVLYIASLAVNVATNSGLLFVLYKYQKLVDLPFKYLIAFVGATGLSAAMNFLGQKFWVFHHKTGLTPETTIGDEFASSTPPAIQ